MITLNFGTVRGLTVEELRQLCDLADVYQYHQGRNAIKDKYYEGHVTLNDVNLGIALPRGLRVIFPTRGGINRLSRLARLPASAPQDHLIGGSSLLFCALPGL